MVEYRGPQFLQEFFESNSISAFDRVTKIRFAGQAAFLDFDLAPFSQLQQVNYDAWDLGSVTEMEIDPEWLNQDKFNESPPKQLTELFSECQLKPSAGGYSIDRSLSCCAAKTDPTQ